MVVKCPCFRDMWQFSFSTSRYLGGVCNITLLWEHIWFVEIESMALINRDWGLNGN